MLKRIAVPFLFGLLTVGASTAAQAQRRSPLADAPAIRKRVELRETRLELGAAIGSTINQTFYHGVMANVHLGFHINDWLSIGAVGAFDVTQVATGFHGDLINTLPLTAVPKPSSDSRAPTQAVASSGINKPGAIFAAEAEVTPFTGKYSLFGKLFAHYDFYAFGGPALVNLSTAKGGGGAPKCADAVAGSTVDVCVVTGSKIGATFGGGFHSFFNNFLALNVELRDVLIKDNPAGRDVNGDQTVNNADLTLTQHWLAVIGLTVYFPANASVSP